MTWQVAIRGVTFGDSTPYLWQQQGPKLFGWDNLRINDSDIPGRPGFHPLGPDLMGGGSSPSRSLTLPFNVLGSNATDTTQLLVDFAAAWAPADSDLELTLTTPGWTRTAIGRPRRVAIPEAPDLAQGVAEAVVEFVMTDPYWYDATDTVVSALLGLSAGGHDYPHNYPHAYGVSTPGYIAVSGGGNAPTAPLLAIFPRNIACSNPLFSILETGEVLAFAGLTVQPGEVLAVSCSDRTAILEPSGRDVASYIDRVASTWWTGSGLLPPGDVTVAGTAVGGGLFVMSYRSAWLT